ncbi:MAG: type II CRISPR RNA-guided endonuclease Cas9, partial [Clostridia bacterium]|nr:type II CRISPR RNA-guided endonuclease Cas9 [Clostridia bacterium]
MKNEAKNGSYYLGLDVGTDSVGYAAVSKTYDLMKYYGKPAWGVTLFDEAALNSERRAYRTARRRLDRRQQRVIFVQELFSEAVSEVDERLFIRQQDSWKHRDEAEDAFSLFADENYTDRDYHSQYPTIHHLIVDLMEDCRPHDVRLVYLACAWLVAHRGHFLSSISVENIEQIKDLSSAYDAFFAWFKEDDKEYSEPWKRGDAKTIGDILKTRMGVTRKYAALAAALFDDGKPSKTGTESFPFSNASMVRLLAGGKVS